MRLIDADALLEDLKKTGRYFQAKFDIENAPTVTIQKWKEEMPDHIQRAMLDSIRPHGKWITRYDTEWHFECNQCKGLSPWKAQFCGVCGADMRGDKK